MGEAHSTHVESLKNEVDTRLIEVLLKLSNGMPQGEFVTECFKAHVYPIEAGGKRIRPLVVLLMAGATGGKGGLDLAANAASAVELIHTYSLVHDDLPCMDNDDFRRGRPTTHKVFGDAKALLVGDGLLTHAFKLAASTEVRTLGAMLVDTLATAAGPQGMVLGQWLDLSHTDSNKPLTWSDVELIHNKKTGALIGASFEMGVLCGLFAGGEPAETQLSFKTIEWFRSTARQAGFELGLAFQIIDDILDVSKTSTELGKTAGKDTNQNKMTAVKLLGAEGAKSKAAEHTRKALDLVDSIFKSDLVASRSDVEAWQKSARAFFNTLLERSH